MGIYKDRSEKVIKKGQVIVIHDKKKYGLSLDFLGLKVGDIGIVRRFGCIELETKKHLYGNRSFFSQSEIEVIGEL